MSPMISAMISVKTSSKKVVPLFLMLVFAAAGLAQALPILCNLDYTVSTQSGAIISTPRDRVCAVRVTYSNGAGFTARTYACTVLTGQTSCSLTVNPAASGVPSGFNPQSAATSLLYSDTEENAGCVYEDGYPSARIDTMMSTQVIVHHRFDCASAP